METVSASFAIALAGGLLIGLAATLLLLTTGRLLGVSGIFAGLIDPACTDRNWRVAFFAGLLAGGLVLLVLYPQAFGIAHDRSLTATVIAGLLVGFGTRLGSGCTSGHGICGISRLSPRSITATIVFMATGIITVFIIQTMFGGSI